MQSFAELSRFLWKKEEKKEGQEDDWLTAGFRNADKWICLLVCFSKSRIREEGVLGLELLAGRAVFLVCVLPLLEPPEESRGLLPYVTH